MKSLIRCSNFWSYCSFWSKDAMVVYMGCHMCYVTHVSLLTKLYYYQRLHLYSILLKVHMCFTSEFMIIDRTWYQYAEVNFKRLSLVSFLFWFPILPCLLVVHHSCACSILSILSSARRFLIFFQLYSYQGAPSCYIILFHSASIFFILPYCYRATLHEIGKSATIFSRRF